MPRFQKVSLYIAGITILFVIKGVFLAIIVPIFQNPDEQIHYGTVQHISEPEENFLAIKTQNKSLTLGSDISTYGLSEEVIKIAQVNQFDEVKFAQENIQHFPGIPETEIVENHWKRYIDTTLNSTSGTKSIYYLIASWLEQAFSNQTILTRIFLARMLATLFGVGTVILAYLTARKIGFSEYIALLLTVLVAFQPMLSITAAQINIDIALIFSFSLFLYSGISLMKDTHWKYTLLVIFSAVLGLFSKGPGIVLAVLIYPLFVWCAYQKFRISKERFATLLAIATLSLVTTLFLIVPKSYLVNITNLTAHSKFTSPLESIGKYIDKTLTIGELRDTAISYWGQFGWLDSSIPDWSLTLVIILTFSGFIGTLWFLFSQRKAPYLPERKYLIFSLGMIIALQVAIRFYDWRVFDYTGQILIGQPGRYFLPNIIAHLLIVTTGIGFLLRQETRFVLAIKILALAMIVLQLNAIVNVIIPRYYL